MTAEEAALIMMSGGNSYTNKSKTITSNGEYEPDEGVRWNKVTVAVPAASTYAEAFGEMPTIGHINLADGWYVQIKYDGKGLIMPTGSYPQLCTVNTDAAGNGGETAVQGWTYHRGIYAAVYSSGEFVCGIKERDSAYVQEFYSKGFVSGTTVLTDFNIGELTAANISVSDSVFMPNTSIKPANSVLGEIEGVLHTDYRRIQRSETGEITYDRTNSDFRSILFNITLANPYEHFSDFPETKHIEKLIELGRALYPDNY